MTTNTLPTMPRDVRAAPWPAPGSHNASRLARIRMASLRHHATRLRRA